MQAIFLVETKSKNYDSDYKYISTIIKHLYDVEKQVKLQPIYLNGKTNYNQCEKKINNYMVAYNEAPNSDRRNEVFLCIDVDDMNHKGNALYNEKLNNKIVEYCKNKSYHLIWFNEDIENVILGRSISKSADKIKAANKFVAEHGEKKIDFKKLSNIKAIPPRGSSNMLNVLDKYLIRKKQF